MKVFSGRWILIIVCLIFSMVWVTAQEETYTVQTGDTIQSIAARFDITTDMLLQYNGIIDPNRIFRGQVLRIPVGVVTAPQTHLVQPGETLQWIAERYNVTLESLLSVNDITSTSQLTVGRVLNLPATGGPSIFTTEHVVQPGQTLREIGELYGVAWETLAEINNLPNPNLLQIGQTIIVPAVSPSPTTNPTPAPAPTVVAPQPQPQPQQQPQTQLRTYVVQVGDNPVLIAERFGVTLDSLLDLNNLRGNLPIFAGDILLIPPTGGSTLGQGGGTTGTAFASPPGQYIVQPGDTLFGIAARYGRNVYDIASDNGLLNLNAIYIGQALTIN